MNGVLNLRAMRPKHLFLLVAIWMGAGAAQQAFAQTQDELDKIRDRLIEFSKAPSERKLVLQRLRSVDEKTQTFLEYYRDVIWPIEKAIDEKVCQSTALSLLIDMGLQRNSQELDRWNSKAEKLDAAIDELAESEDYLKNNLHLAELSKGIKGPFADFIRNSAEALKLESLHDIPQSDRLRLRKLERMLERSYANHPLANKVSEIEEEMETLTESETYVTPKARLARLKVLYRDGPEKFGRVWMGRNGRYMEELAQLRSRIARQKGYYTWTAYQLAMDRLNWTPSLQSLESRKAFLADLTTAIAAPLRSAQIKLTKGLDLPKNTPLGLLAYLIPEPTAKAHFAEQSLVASFDETLRGWGISQKEVLDKITWDSFPREGKNSYAYMMTVFFRNPRQLTIDGETLTVKEPLRSRWWINPEVHIIQNLKEGGVMNLISTVFHEGGHAWDHLTQRNPLSEATSNAAIETPSTLMEFLGADPKILQALSQKVRGKKLSGVQADRLAAYIEISQLLQMDATLRMAAIDLDLWDYDYENGKEGFVERALRLARESLPDAPRSAAWSIFRTDHLTSGTVDYFGYAAAAVGAYALRDAILNKYEALDGVRTTLGRKDFGAFLQKGLLEKGWSPAFPEGITLFTGRRFSPLDLGQLLKPMVDRCDLIFGK